MANPQLEDGYTRVANQILEKVSKLPRINGTQLQIILTIWRFTYGFKRKHHELSISFIAEATEKAPRQIERELSKLIARRIITVVSEASGKRSRILGFNKNFDEWESVDPSKKTGQAELTSPDELDGSDPTKKTVRDASSTDELAGEERKYLKKGFKEKESLFENFYVVYPRKVNKSYALKTWIKLCKAEEFDPDIVIANTINFADTCKLLNTGTKFIPHPSTYLNQKRWEDYPVIDPEGLAAGSDKVSDNLEFLKNQLGGAADDGKPSELTNGQSMRSLPEQRPES